MASSGRGASVRRPGLKVIGKIAAPKPINLPSQRSENNGADPNVELVPSGTHTWGCRPSSASNMLGSSTPDGSSGSPSRLSGTRPSTAGSDRTNESSSSARGSNSRPSSASGALPSNQTGISLLPCSAETRPGSSHLSRFAETLSDNPVAWGGVGTVEKLGGVSSKNNEFSLTSGDFPTLGYEKNHSRKNPQDQGTYSRPGSSSSCAEPPREHSGYESLNAESNNWRKDGSPSSEDSRIQAGAERWQGAPQLCPSANNAPQHFDSWHATPMGGPPGAVWFRGPAGGPPYQAPPGGFPIEPYPYYCPQAPPPVLSNSQAAASALRGHPPNVGDFYRPPLSEAYMHPGAPIRPGYFHGPVSYDGYYAPPAGYYNHNERNIPFMGMSAAPQPSPYMGYSGQNIPDACYSGSCSDGKPLVSEQPESVHHHHKPQPNMVLLKHHNGRDRRDEEPNWDHAVATGAPYLDKEDHIRWSSLPNDQESGDSSTDDLKSGEEPYRRTTDKQAISSDFGKHESSRGMLDSKAIDDNSINKAEIISASSKVSQLLSNHPKDASLIQKIEGLNAKARASGGRHNISSVSHSDYLNVETNATYPDTYFENCTGSGVTRRGDHLGGADFNTRGVGWQKNSLHANTSTVVLAIDSETASNLVVEDHMSDEATERSLLHLHQKDNIESLPPTFDPTDSQREKMRELARLKAKQLEKEEEERIREQKAKARAKLEELDRRTKAAEGFTSNEEQYVDHFKNNEQMRIMVSATDSSNIKSEDDIDMMGESVISMKLPLGETDSQKVSVLPHNLSLPSQPDSVNNFAADSKLNISKRNQFGYKQKKSVPSGKSSPEISIPSEAPKSHTIDPVHSPSAVKVANSELSLSGELSINPSPVPQSSVYPKRKNNRFSKNKQKVEEAASMDIFPKEPLSGGGKSEISEMNAAPRSEELNDLKNSSQTSDGHMKVNNNWKPQPSRKVSRNSQADKEKLHGGDSVVWAPVRSHNKAEAAVDVIKDEAASASAYNSDLPVQSSPKNRRAEIERYVPKPVAKELAQQGGNQQPETPVGHMEFDEVITTTGVNSRAVAPAKTTSPMDVRGGERRQNQNHAAKPNKSWRQRGSANSKRAEISQDGSLTNHSRIIESSFTEKPFSKEPQADYYDEWDPPDGWNNPPKMDSAAPPSYPVLKDSGAMDGGKRNQFKGHRVPANNSDSNHRNSNSSGGKDRAYTHAPNIEGGNNNNISKESHGGVSQWQPKSQPQANKSGGWSNDEGFDDPSLKHSNPKHDDRRSRKSGSSKGRPRSPQNNHAARHIDPDSSANGDFQQGFFPKNGNQNQNSRFGRGRHDISSGEPSSQRHNMHYEYQATNRSQNDNKVRRSEKDCYGAQRVTGMDRGESQSSQRRGGRNFRGPPQSCSVQGDAGYSY